MGFHRMLDLDLDFFLDHVAEDRHDDGPRLDSETFRPWAPEKVREFLEDRCLLSRASPIPGRFVKHHDGAFFWWRELINKAELKAPFLVFHVDAHSDTGYDASMDYIMTEWLHLPPEERVDPVKGNKGIHPGNYLIFAAGCRWVEAVVYIYHPESGDDFGRFHFKDNHPSSLALQLKACSPDDLRGPLTMYGPQNFVPEPEVPFLRTSTDKFQAREAFTHGLLCQSPGFTPSAADDLIPIIMEYFRE